MKTDAYSAVSATVDAKIAIAEFAAEKLGRSDIAGWNYNNAAYDLIKQFKVVTNYEVATADLLNTPSGHRDAKLADLKATFEGNIALLQLAGQILDKAETTGGDNGFKSKIKSNRKFIYDIKKLIATK
jgi:hypothetical protein